MSSPKDCSFPETIPEEASSVEEERVVIFRLPASTHMMDTSVYTVYESVIKTSDVKKKSKPGSLNF